MPAATTFVCLPATAAPKKGSVVFDPKLAFVGKGTFGALITEVGESER